MAAGEIEFMRWRAERWIKMKHFPNAALHSPAFVVRHGREMLRHTFAGCSWRSFFSAEGEREAFVRFKAVRAAERARLRDDLDAIPVDIDERPIPHAAGSRAVPV